jgi:thymidylate synthase
MYTIKANSLQGSLYGILYRLKYEGKDVEVRGLKTRELHPCFIEIENPQKRHLLYPKRGNNPFASLAETMWVLGNRNDMEWLEKFLPRCKDYSDDGRIWRAAYGPRIRE